MSSLRPSSSLPAPPRRRVASLVLFVVTALVAAGCTRPASQVETGAAPSVSVGATAGGAAPSGAAAAGTFGDLKNVCGPGNAKGATAQGVTDDEIKVGTISDPGFTGAPGLNQELFDASEVFVKWCNAAGGINGRKIVDTERDAKLTEYKQRVTESCQQDFMLVGGGGVFDDTGQEERLRCLLPEFPALQVSAAARAADLAVRPVSLPLDKFGVGAYRYMAKKYPDSTDKVGFLTGNVASLILVDRQAQDAAKKLGWKVAYQAQYNALGEASWTPFVQAMRSKGVKGLVYTGEPQNFAKLLQAGDDIGYQFDWVIGSANLLDESFIKAGGSAIRHVYAPSVTVPPFLADKNPATKQYLQLFEKYLPKGKSKALLGFTSFSAWLLWATSVKSCGSDVTRRCVYDAGKSTTKWTAGGLHAPTDPATGQAPTCSILVEATPKGFELPSDFKATDGLFRCDPKAVVTITGDYGRGTTLADVGKSLDDLD